MSVKTNWLEDYATSVDSLLNKGVDFVVITQQKQLTWK